MKKFREEVVKIDKIVGGGQSIGVLESGKKVFVWGALPDETARVQIYKSKSSYAEAVAVEILQASPHRIDPIDPESYLSTSPWQIMTYACELDQKKQLVREAFELSHVDLPDEISIMTDGREYEYRNKIEYSFWWDKNSGQLDLAFFRRGTHGKIPIQKTSLADPTITQTSRVILEWLRESDVESRALKTLLIRSSRDGEVCAQLYVKDLDFMRRHPKLNLESIEKNFLNLEIIYSNPKSPASVITEKIFTANDQTLSDEILGKRFNYATEGFFQINLPVYEMALREIAGFITTDRIVDMYAGVGTIGLSVAEKRDLTLVETDDSAFAELQNNATADRAKAIHAKSEQALEYITHNITLIVDPPRAGLHENVCEAILERRPSQIIYLSCNPVTQARDIAKLLPYYKIVHQRAFNFFPRTPHIENLVVLSLDQ